jgi:hypothetical protein
MLELAREAASLGFERRRLERLGKTAAQVSSRRIDALVRIGAIAVERHRHRPHDFDVRSDKFQTIVRCFLEIMRETVNETVDRETAEVFLARVEERLRGWEDAVDPAPRGSAGVGVDAK